MDETRIAHRGRSTARRPSKRRRRRFRTFIATVVLLVLLVCGVGFSAWALLYRVETDVAAGQVVQLTVPSGASTAQIGSILASAGVVPNANMFRLRSRMSDSDGELKAGEYGMTTGMSYDEAIEILTAGPTIVYFTVTIPEGFVIEQIAARFEQEAGIPAAEFLELAAGGVEAFPDHPYLASTYQGSLEGYLFPKTYTFPEGTTAREIIETMLVQFDTEMQSVNMDAAQARGMTLHDVVTIGSIVEREAKVSQDRELVSSVIYNRLDRDMKLEICATVEYVLPGTRFRLTNEDLKTDSPYNTYMYGGLPPGPIASPGLAALQAAVAPAQSDYLYYVLTGEDGSHTFASTYEEFQAAKDLSKEVFGQ